MKRLLVLALLALGLTIVLVPMATPAGPAPLDAQGPPCSEITSGDGFYSSAGVLDFTVFLQAPACSFVTYTFVVTDTEGNTLASLSPDTEVCTTESGGCVHFSVDLGDSGPTTVCVSATTKIKGHLADLAPFVPDTSLTCPQSSPSMILVRGGTGASGPFG
jgi:hypothetical protein